MEFRATHGAARESRAQNGVDLQGARGRSWPTLGDDGVHGRDGDVDVGQHPRPAAIRESPVGREVFGDAFDKSAARFEKAFAQAYEVECRR